MTWVWVGLAVCALLLLSGIMSKLDELSRSLRTLVEIFEEGQEAFLQEQASRN